MEAPKEIKNQQMTLKQKKYFATFITGGASFTLFRREHLRITEKDVSRSTYARIKRDSKKKWDTVTHREKNLSYQTENDTEKKQWESHVKEAILKCYRRKYIIKFSYTLVASILTNEREKFPHFGWLRKLEFTGKYVTRYLHENDLVFSSRKSDQIYIGPDQLSSYRKVI